MQDYKMKPYDRLQSIFVNDKELTDKASERLNKLLGEEVVDKKSIFKNIIDSFLSFFSKIDSLIFRKPGRKNNTTYYKRK
jgi:hypothetical protein